MFAFHDHLKLTAVIAGSLVIGALSAPVGGATSQEAAEAVVIDSGWVVAHGPDIVEETAANQLAGELVDDHGVSVEVRSTGSTSNVTAWLRREKLDAAGVIIIGTPEDNPLTAASHRSTPFDLPPDEPEAYHLSERTAAMGLPLLYITGASPKGAMNGVFRLEQQFLDRTGLDVVGLDDAASPAFVNRVGGHKFTQAPPPGWTGDQQAEYYAANYINVVWGEKYGPPLAREAREKWGLKLALEVPLPPVDGAWLDDPANASAVYWRETPSGQRRVVSPFDDIGRQAYLDAFTEALDENPDTAILSTVFGDYSFATDANSTRVSDGSPCECTKESSALEVMKILAEAVEDHPAVPAAWLWHLYPAEGDEAFLEELHEGVGVIYNEAGNADNWITNRINFNATALAEDETGQTRWGPDYAVLVSAGGSDESVKPAIGMPLPHMTASKIRTLADLGVQTFYLWWGSVEGWTYSANISVIREMIWNPGLFDPTDSDPFNSDDPEPLLDHVATADFGAALAPDVLRYWQAVDDAVVNPAPDGSSSGLPIYSWYQRLAIYLNPGVFGGGAALRPLTPEAMKSAEFNVYRPWAVQDGTLAVLQQVADDLAAAKALGESIDDGSSPRLAQMRQWTELYTHVFTSRLRFAQALKVADAHADVDDPEFRAAIEPIAAEEIATVQAMESALAALPENATFYSGSRQIFNNNVDRDRDLGITRAKRLSTQLWFDGLTNIVPTATVTASSAPDSARAPALAVDRDWSTSWRSANANNHWLAVDLGTPQATDAVVVRWNPDNAATHYQVQIADTADGPWTTVADVPQPTGRDDAIVLPLGTTTQHLRILGLTRANANFSIRELEVYALGGDGAITAVDAGCVAGDNGSDVSLQVVECDGTAGHDWTLPGDGTVQTQDYCLTAGDPSSAVWLSECTDTDDQQWRWQPSDPAEPGGLLVNPQSGGCLDTQASDATNESLVVLLDCPSGQRWTLPPAAPELDPAVRLTDPPSDRLVQPGVDLRLTAEVSGLAPGVEGSLTIDTPDGWAATPPTQHFAVAAGRAVEVEFDLTIPADAIAGRHVIGLRADIDDLAAERTVELTVGSGWESLDLAPLLNLDVASDHGDYGASDFDGFGNSYPAEELPAPGPVEQLGVPFDFPVTGTGMNDVVASQGQTLTPPAGRYGAAVFLGAARGSVAEAITVTYADGSTAEVPFRFPGWGSAAALEPGDEIAIATTHRHHQIDGEVCCSVRVYAEIVDLDPDRELVSITLPDNDRLRIFAATLAATDQPLEQN